MRYTHHIFICTNQKAEGKKCCGEERGMELVKECRRLLTEKGLKGVVRAQKSGCLDACDFGPACVVYPEGVYYQNLDPQKMAEIVDKHIVGGEVVQEYVLTDFEKKT